MDKNPVFRELLTILPDLAGLLRGIAIKHSEVEQTRLQLQSQSQPPQNTRKRAASSNDDPPVTTTIVGPHPLRSASPDAKLLEVPPPTVGAGRMPPKASGPKQKFSSINGPQIFYDGESQQTLFNCWTTLNSKRGLLRKEMMAVKRKRIMMMPLHQYGYGDDSDEEGEGKDAVVETEEEREAREEEERRKAQEERLKLEREKKAAEVVECIDSCLDKASKGCENAAFLWLKGDVCTGHINYINARMQEAVDRIQIELEKANPKPVEPVPSVAEDEGIGAEMDVDPPKPTDSATLPPRKMDTAMHASRLIGVS